MIWTTFSTITFVSLSILAAQSVGLIAYFVPMFLASVIVIKAMQNNLRPSGGLTAAGR